MTEEEMKEWFEERAYYDPVPTSDEDRYQAFKARLLSEYVLLERGSNEDYERWKRAMVLDHTPK